MAGAPVASHHHIEICQRETGVLDVTISNPAVRNAMGLPDWLALGDVFRELDPSRSRVVVLRGAGGAFCAGADLQQPFVDPLENMRLLSEVADRVIRCPVPVIAAVDGPAVGAGLNLALASDFVIATERSSFSEIFVRRALAIDFGGSWLLPRLVGLGTAKRLTLLGEILDAKQAKQAGLLYDVVVDANELERAADALCAQLLPLPADALDRSKYLLNMSFDATLDEALNAEAVSQAQCMVSSNVQEALNAFRQKREPRYNRA